MKTFEEAFAETGYQYGEDALEQVRLGWDLAQKRMRPREKANYTNREWLFQKYVTEKLSSPAIGKLENVNAVSIRYWLHKFHIPIRDDSEQRRGKPSSFKGKKHTAESRKKISDHHANVSGRKNPMYGKTGVLAPKWERTADYREKLSVTRRGVPRPNLAGVNNPNWKGGKVGIVVNIRNSLRCIEWRNAVFARDNYTCQDCKHSRGGNLNAHHIVYLSTLVSKYNIKTVHEANQIDELWDLSNGVTLCKECHALRHARNSQKD